MHGTDTTGTAQTGQAHHKQDRHSIDTTGTAQTGQAQHKQDRHSTDTTGTAQARQAQHRHDRHSTNRTGTAQTGQAQHRQDRHSIDRTGTAIFAITLLLHQVLPLTIIAIAPQTTFLPMWPCSMPAFAFWHFVMAFFPIGVEI